MTTQPTAPTIPPPARPSVPAARHPAPPSAGPLAVGHVRRLVRGLGALLLGLLVLGLLAARLEYGLEDAAARTYPPPGRLVDVGGHRLHLYCTGSASGAGSPTVVIDAGWGDWSAGWSSVQPEVAKTARVCTYDRAGMGHSEPGSLPRTAEQFARELRALLHTAGVEGPYVMVGHSLGGLPVRVFAHAYPSEVAGVVLVDSMNPGEMGTTAPTTPPVPGSPSVGARAMTDALLTLPARVGLVRLFTGPTPGLSTHDASAYAARSVTTRSLQAAIDEGRGMPESLAQARRVATLGSTPLIVLSRGLPQDDQPKWDRAQADLLRLSSNSRQLVAERSHHNIQWEQPAAAVSAIVEMLRQLRGY